MKRLILFFTIITCFFGCDSQGSGFMSNFHHYNCSKHRDIPHKPGMVIIHAQYTIPAAIVFKNSEGGYLSLKPGEYLRVYRIDESGNGKYGADLMYYRFRFYLQDETVEKPILDALKELGAKFDIYESFDYGHHRVCYVACINDIEWKYEAVRYPWDDDDDEDRFDED